jgi:hypothetical protein
MKSISKVVIAALVAACFTINAHASVHGLPVVDTGKMSKKMDHKMDKMDHKMSKKMDKKMDKMDKMDKMGKKGKMAKDTMSKM